MTAFCRRLVVVLSVILLLGLAVPVGHAAAQPPDQLEQTEGFEPISELPPEEKVPAAPLLIAAYSFVVVVLFVYVLSVSRRLAVVQREVERLEGDVKRAGRA